MRLEIFEHTTGVEEGGERVAVYKALAHLTPEIGAVGSLKREQCGGIGTRLVIEPTGVEGAEKVGAECKALAYLKSWIGAASPWEKERNVQGGKQSGDYLMGTPYSAHSCRHLSATLRTDGSSVGASIWREG